MWLEKSTGVIPGSWATGVEWWLTRMIYPTYQGGEIDNPNYTQVVVDMVDRRSDDGNNFGAIYPFDRVEGYTMHQIEQALIGAKTWTQWRDNIINNYNNESENQLDSLFAYWSN